MYAYDLHFVHPCMDLSQTRYEATCPCHARIHLLSYNYNPIYAMNVFCVALYIWCIYVCVCVCTDDSKIETIFPLDIYTLAQKLPIDTHQMRTVNSHTDPVLPQDWTMISLKKCGSTCSQITVVNTFLTCFSTSLERLKACPYLNFLEQNLVRFGLWLFWIYNSGRVALTAIF